MIEQIMKQEIEKRSKDKTWGMSIANKIIARKKRQQRLLYSATSIAFVLIVFTIVYIKPFIFTNQPQLTYNNTITAQVQGVYKAVFSIDKKNIKSTNSKSNNDIILNDSDVDDVIDSALADRL